MNQEETDEHIKDINKMSHIEMAKLWRFAPISKQIGWDK